MDVFVTRLRTLSKTCNFGKQTDEAIRDQVIDKCVSKELRRRLLREPDIDFLKLLTISRAFEQSHFQAKEMEQPLQSNDSINAIRPRYNTANSSGSRRQNPSHFNGASQGPSQLVILPLYVGAASFRFVNGRCQHEQSLPTLSLRFPMCSSHKLHKQYKYSF